MLLGSGEQFALLKYLDGLVDDLRKLIPPALKGLDEESIHDARVATRRLKAATDLLASVVSGRSRKSFNRVTRRLRRQLGPLRDLDVMMDHLARVKTAKFEAAVKWLTNRLSECRAEAVAEAQEKAPPARMLARLGSWWGLRQEIADSHDAVDYLLAESVHLQLDAFAEQADELVKGGKSDPHQLRIAGKSLRYTLEMARAHQVPISGGLISLFKKMQERLGLWHDYVVLTERMLRETVECDLVLHDPSLQGQILNFAQTVLSKAQRELKLMHDLWKERGNELCGQIRHAFPLTKPVLVATPAAIHAESHAEKSVEKKIEEPPPAISAAS
jgi:CHAD domain-containing protein